MPMKNPPHPGRSIRTACLEPLGLSVTAGAEVLGVTRQTLNNVIHGKGCSLPMISHRPEKTRAKSRSAVSMCSRNCTRNDLRPRKAESNRVGCSAGHFSRSVRSGAPTVISVNVKRQIRAILPR